MRRNEQLQKQRPLIKEKQLDASDLLIQNLLMRWSAAYTLPLAEDVS